MFHICVAKTKYRGARIKWAVTLEQEGLGLLKNAFFFCATFISMGIETDSLTYPLSGLSPCPLGKISLIHPHHSMHR